MNMGGRIRHLSFHFTILGQINTWIKFKHIKKVQEIDALVCKEESDESLIDLDFLQDMGIIHKDFPLPMNKTAVDAYCHTRLHLGYSI